MDPNDLFYSSLDIPRSVARRFHLLPRITRDDVHAHALVALWEAVNTWDRVRPFRSWAWTKCLYCIKELVRQELKRGFWLLPRNVRLNWAEFDPLDRALQYSLVVRDASFWDLALRDLEPAEADVVRAVFLDGRNHYEAAEALGIPRTTVSYRYRCACRKLKPILAAEA